MSSSNLPPKAKTSGLSRSLSRDSYNNKDDAQHNTLETAPVPSALGFISSIWELGRNLESILNKSLKDLSEREREPHILISEVIWQTVSSQDSERFSVANPDKFDGSRPEKLETFEAQCCSVFLSNERKYADPTCQAIFTGSYLEGAAFKWWKNELKKPTDEFKKSTPQFWTQLWNCFRNLEDWCVVEEKLTFLQMKETDHVN